MDRQIREKVVEGVGKLKNQDSELDDIKETGMVVIQNQRAAGLALANQREDIENAITTTHKIDKEVKSAGRKIRIITI